jgi:hypothetical protein
VCSFYTSARAAPHRVRIPRPKNPRSVFNLSPHPNIFSPIFQKLLVISHHLCYELTIMEKKRTIQEIEEQIQSDPNNYWNRARCAKQPCTFRTVLGGRFCFLHSEKPVSVRRLGSEKLKSLIEPALDCLEQAMLRADWPHAIKASLAILDRAGLSVVHKMEVLQKAEDFTSMSRDELAARAAKIAERLAQENVGRQDVPKVKEPHQIM